VLLRNTLIVNVSIAEKLMNYTNLHLIMLNQNALEVKTLPQISYQVVGSVIRIKEVATGFNGCVKHSV